MDERPRGIWRYTMRGPDAKDWPNVDTYEQLVPPERLLYLHGHETEPDTYHNTLTFDDHHGKTALTMRAVFKTAAAREFVVRERGAVEGGQQTVARLERYVRTMGRSGSN